MTCVKKGVLMADGNHKLKCNKFCNDMLVTVQEFRSIVRSENTSHQSTSLIVASISSWWVPNKGP